MQNGKKEEKLALHLGILSSTLSQRSLVLPPNTLNPGTYLVQLMVYFHILHKNLLLEMSVTQLLTLCI